MVIVMNAPIDTALYCRAKPQGSYCLLILHGSVENHPHLELVINFQVLLKNEKFKVDPFADVESLE